MEGTLNHNNSLFGSCSIHIDLEFPGEDERSYRTGDSGSGLLAPLFVIIKRIHHPCQALLYTTGRQGTCLASWSLADVLLLYTENDPPIAVQLLRFLSGHLYRRMGHQNNFSSQNQRICCAIEGPLNALNWFRLDVGGWVEKKGRSFWFTQWLSI